MSAKTFQRKSHWSKGLLAITFIPLPPFPPKKKMLINSLKLAVYWKQNLATMIPFWEQQLGTLWLVSIDYSDQWNNEIQIVKVTGNAG